MFLPLGLCPSALANVSFLWHNGKFLPLITLSILEDKKKSFHEAPLCRVSPNPSCAQWWLCEGPDSFNLSVVMCKDPEKGKISDLYETLELLLSTFLLQEDVMSNPSGLRALCVLSPLSPSEICVKLELNHETHLIKRQMAK